MSKSAVITAYKAEMIKMRAAYQAANWNAAFAHLERGHILGQRYFFPHLTTHFWMLAIGMKRKDKLEIRGQITRSIAVIPGFIFGWVPKGNTGGAGVSPIKPMPYPEDLQPILESYNVWKDVGVRALLLASIAIFIRYIWPLL